MLVRTSQSSDEIRRLTLTAYEDSTVPSSSDGGHCPSSRVARDSACSDSRTPGALASLAYRDSWSLVTRAAKATVPSTADEIRSRSDPGVSCAKRAHRRCGSTTRQL